MKMGEIPQMEIPIIPTGSIALDWALGVGGIPRGRVIEIFGPESSGKNHSCPTHRCRSPKNGGYSRLY